MTRSPGPGAMATASRSGRRTGSGDSRSQRMSDLGHRGAVRRSPLPLAERADFQQLDAERRDPLDRGCSPGR